MSHEQETRPSWAAGSRVSGVIHGILRARPEITESTFDRVRYGLTTCLGYHML